MRTLDIYDFVEEDENGNWRCQECGAPIPEALIDMVSQSPVEIAERHMTCKRECWKIKDNW